MKITKYGHCCLLIECKGKNFLTDPGAWNVLPDELPHVDIILITHEHSDHLHAESLQTIVNSNPNVRILTNTSVGKVLTEKGFAFEIIDDSTPLVIDELLLEFYTVPHREIYGDFGVVENTGFFIDNKLFYPGDAFTNPGKSVDVLAAPLIAPWTDLKTAINYILEIKPRMAFPVHDGQIQPSRPGPAYKLTQQICKENSINFVELHAGGSCSC